MRLNFKRWQIHKRYFIPILSIVLLLLSIALISTTERIQKLSVTVEAKGTILTPLQPYHHRTKSSMVAFVTSSSSPSSNLLIPSQAIKTSSCSSKQQRTNTKNRGGIHNCNNDVVSQKQSKSSQRMTYLEDVGGNPETQTILSLIPSQSVNSRINQKRLPSSTNSFARKSNSDRAQNFYHLRSSTSLSLSRSSSSENDEMQGRDEGGGTSTINQLKDDKSNDNDNDNSSSNSDRNGEGRSKKKGNQSKKSKVTMKMNIKSKDGLNNNGNDTSHKKYRSKRKSSKTKFQNKSISSNEQQQRRQKLQQQQHQDKYQQSFRYTGNLPDIYWRAIPMKHLRSHPSYQPLPKPKAITYLSHLEDVRQFRQDSWQWDMLHSGRCTTSQAAPALGLLENHAAKMLGIPKSLQKGCMGAYVRLGQSALRTLEEMNSVLCCHDEQQYDYYNVDDGDGEEEWFYQTYNNNNNDSSNVSGTNSTYQVRRRIWKKMPKQRYPFAAKYSHPITMEQIYDRRQQTKKYMSTLSSPMRIRMNWGNSQEATAILTALNYFYSVDPDVIVKEVGMCGAGLKYNATSFGRSSQRREDDNHDIHDLILGASPDAVIQYSNGTLEALEVKNHCPFIPNRRQQREDGNDSTSSITNSTIGRGRSSYRIREMPIQATVPPAYIPQLMMEMLCLGDECKSAIMCRQTATNGAVLVRLRRDDEWIDEMIYWLERFVNDYVKKGTPPPRNFFWFDDDGNLCDRYQRFVRRTKELSDGVELVKYIEHGSIQRVLGDQGVRLPLFLD